MIRQAILEDAGTLSKIVSLCYRNFEITDDYPPTLIAELIQFRGMEDSIVSLIKNESVFVADCDEEIVGMVSCDQNEITKLYVHPDFQKQGIGTLLFRHAKSFIGSHGFAELFLGIAVPSAEAFYVKMGMHLSERKLICQGPCKGRNIVIMKAKIQ
jgi:GNAT superfamily N-acetyltransferase